MQHHNDAMTALRGRSELAVAGALPPAAIDVQFAPVAKELAEINATVAMLAKFQPPQN